MNSWHKQELFKGRGVFNGLGGTTWAGWNINMTFSPNKRKDDQTMKRMAMQIAVAFGAAAMFVGSARAADWTLRE